MRLFQIIQCCPGVASTSRPLLATNPAPGQVQRELTCPIMGCALETLSGTAISLLDILASKASDLFCITSAGPEITRR